MGLLTLSDVHAPTLALACEGYGRRGRYNVERFNSEHGADAKLTDLLHKLADCSKARSLSIHDRCKAVNEGLTAARIDEP